MAKGQKGQPDISTERRDRLRATAKPATEILFDVDDTAQQVMIVARGKLDITETVIVLSIPDAANVALTMVQLGAAALVPTPGVVTH